MTGDFFAALPHGTRIVVRYRRRADDGGAPLTDALGDFEGRAGGEVAIRTRSGLVRVPVTDITHAKRVPPPPQRRRGGTDR